MLTTHERFQRDSRMLSRMTRTKEKFTKIGVVSEFSSRIGCDSAPSRINNKPFQQQRQHQQHQFVIAEENKIKIYFYWWKCAHCARCSDRTNARNERIKPPHMFIARAKSSQCHRCAYCLLAKEIIYNIFYFGNGCELQSNPNEHVNVILAWSDAARGRLLPAVLLNSITVAQHYCLELLRSRAHTRTEKWEAHNRVNAGIIKITSDDDFSYLLFKLFVCEEEFEHEKKWNVKKSNHISHKSIETTAFLVSLLRIAMGVFIEWIANVFKYFYSIYSFFVFSFSRFAAFWMVW